MSMKKRLDQSMIYAYRSAVKTDLKPSKPTMYQWVWRLVGCHYLSYISYLEIEKASQHFAFHREWKTLAEWAANKVREERNHHLLALDDIDSMGYNPKAVVEALNPPMITRILGEYVHRCVQSPDPIGCVGYSYAIERIAVGIKESHIRSVEALVPPGVNATRCLRVHSSIGSDVKHAEETAEMVAGLSDQERKNVLKSCYETALLYFQSLRKDYISDEQLEYVLRPCLK